MSIKTLWNRLFGIKVIVTETHDAELKIALKAIPLSAGIAPFSDKQMELFECFYGTLVDREPPTHRKKHAHDGWREGCRHPFEFEGETHDVEKTNDLSLELYENLMFRLTYGIGMGEIPSPIPYDELEEQ